MGAVRDPVSVAYDTTVRRVLIAAIRAHQRNRDKPRAAVTFIYSPPRTFRQLDAGGHTEQERGFTRAIYFHIYRVPIKLGLDPVWSARLEWGKITRRPSGWGRPVKVRLFVYGTKAARAAARRGTWITDDGTGTFREGTRRSLPGARIDSQRRRRP